MVVIVELDLGILEVKYTLRGGLALYVGIVQEDEGV